MMRELGHDTIGFPEPPLQGQPDLPVQVDPAERRQLAFQRLPDERVREPQAPRDIRLQDEPRAERLVEAVQRLSRWDPGDLGDDG